MQIINGAFAGLAGITPASGYIAHEWAFATGLVVGLASYFSVVLLRDKLQIDDALDVTSLQVSPTPPPALLGILVSFFHFAESR